MSTPRKAAFLFPRCHPDERDLCATKDLGAERIARVICELINRVFGALAYLALIGTHNK